MQPDAVQFLYRHEEGTRQNLILLVGDGHCIHLLAGSPVSELTAHRRACWQRTRCRASRPRPHGLSCTACSNLVLNVWLEARSQKLEADLWIASHCLPKSFRKTPLMPSPAMAWPWSTRILETSNALWKSLAGCCPAILTTRPDISWLRRRWRKPSARKKPEKCWRTESSPPRKRGTATLRRRWKICWPNWRRPELLFHSP